VKNADVIVVGAGLVGAAAAYECAKAGAKVVLIDKKNIGTGASGNSAAMLELQIDAYRGEPFFSLAKASHDLFPALIRDLTAETAIDTGYEPCSIMQVAMNPEEAVVLEAECQRQLRLGLRARWLTPTQVANHVPDLTHSIYGAALFHEDGNVNGLPFLRALCTGAEKAGAELIFNAGDVSLLLDGPRVVGVRYGVEQIMASKIVVSAGAWIDSLLAPLSVQLHVTPVRGQLVVFETPERVLPFPIYTKTGGYLTPKKDGITLAGSTIENAGFDASPTAEGRERILNLVRSLYPKLLRFPIRTVTAGLRPKSPDDLPLIGVLPEHPNVFIASGHYRNGVLLSPISGKMAALFASGQPMPDAFRVFSPERLFSKR
jgi:glycine oxidase